MPFFRRLAAVTASLLIALPTMAGDIDHFKGEPAKTLEQAVTNFSKYNNQLETLLAGELSPAVMGQIHQLTYSLENALETLDDSIDQLEDSLEEVHKASERADTTTVKSSGKQYLTNSRKIIP